MVKSLRSDYTGLDDVAPESFEWLDLAEQFYKSDDCRTTPIRNGTVYESIESEYRMLKRLHEEIPETTVEPLKPIYGRDGEMDGFYMERIEGETINSSNFPEESLGQVYSELEALVESLHDKGLAHGDLIGNVLYTEEGPKVFDPVGVPETEGDLEKFREEDLRDLERWEKKLGNPVKPEL